MRELCPHCQPYKYPKAHFSEQVDKLMHPLLSMFSVFEHLLPQQTTWGRRMARFLLYGFFNTLLFFRILQECSIHDDDETLSNRVLVTIREARDRGFEVTSFTCCGSHTNFFRLRSNSHSYLFEGLPSINIADISGVDSDDKTTLKQFLEKQDALYPKGKTFRWFKKAKNYVAKELGFPVVVKPFDSSLSRHVTVNVQNIEALGQAFKIAKIISRKVIVERYVPGKLFRLTVVGGKFVAGAKREPPSVTGDGIHTIEELVEEKNRKEERGDIDAKNVTLKKLRITPVAQQLLEKQQHTSNSVPKKGERVYLHTKAVLPAGADVIDCTDKVHSEIRDLVERLSTEAELSVAGIDMLAQDITLSPGNQDCGIIDMNTVPYIDMHHYPSEGKSRDVAGAMFDAIFI